MRAYKCDACGRVFLLPDNSLNFEGPEDNDIPEDHVPATLYHYSNKGIATCYDLCKECTGRILQEIERIHFNYQSKREFEFAPKNEVYE